MTDQDNTDGSKGGEKISVRFVDLIAYWPIVTTLIVISSAIGVQFYFSQNLGNGFYVMGVEDYVTISVLGVIVGVVGILGGTCLLICAISLPFFFILILVNHFKSSFNFSFEKLTIKEKTIVSLKAASRFLIIFCVLIISWVVDLISNNICVINKLSNDIVLFGDVDLWSVVVLLLFLLFVAFVISSLNFNRIGRVGFIVILSSVVISTGIGAYLYFTTVHEFNYHVNMDTLRRDLGGKTTNKSEDANLNKEQVKLNPNKGNHKAAESDGVVDKPSIDKEDPLSMCDKDNNRIIWSGSKAVVLECNIKEDISDSNQKCTERSENIDRRKDKFVIITNPDNVQLIGQEFSEQKRSLWNKAMQQIIGGEIAKQAHPDKPKPKRVG